MTQKFKYQSQIDKLLEQGCELPPIHHFLRYLAFFDNELMTYELTIPYHELSKFETMLSHIGVPLSALKKIAAKTVYFDFFNKQKYLL